MKKKLSSSNNSVDRIDIYEHKIIYVDKSFAEIAAILNMSEKKVQSIFYRALKKMSLMLSYYKD